MSVRSVLAVVALGLWASLAVHFPSASAQDSVCDSLLDNDVAGPWAYGQRENRCEGLYVEQVSGAVLAIVSLTSVFEDYDLDRGTPFIVEWTAPGPARCICARVRWNPRSTTGWTAGSGLRPIASAGL